MDHYIDIRIQPDAEMRENVLLNKVYTKFHKALCTLNADDIGVSFPEYKIKLGRVLRIHGRAERLGKLQKLQWLGGLSGYCNISEINHVPDGASYRVISRIQTTMSPAKYRRLLARGTITEQEQRQYKAKMFQKGLDNPYLELESASSKQLYRRYIQFGEIKNAPVDGIFDTFGLSKTATVPHFD